MNSVKMGTIVLSFFITQIGQMRQYLFFCFDNFLVVQLCSILSVGSTYFYDILNFLFNCVGFGAVPALLLFVG